jgi:hypothetical protein
LCSRRVFFHLLAVGAGGISERVCV